MLKKFWNYLRKKKGSVVLEAALCIPILLYLIFFTLEVIRMGIYQVAVDNMALKIAFDYSGLKSSANIDKIVETAKPAFFKSMDGIYCRIYIFSSLKALVNATKTREPPSWENSSIPSLQYPEGIKFDPFGGCAILVTVSYNFPFSSASVKKLFAGGTNYEGNFLLWSRAVNVCN